MARSVLFSSMESTTALSSSNDTPCPTLTERVCVCGFVSIICRHRENDARVLVKLIDRGDEILVDTSELLKLDGSWLSIPAFAQPFRLEGYDQSVSRSGADSRTTEILSI